MTEGGYFYRWVFVVVLDICFHWVKVFSAT